MYKATSRRARIWNLVFTAISAAVSIAMTLWIGLVIVVTVVQLVWGR